MVNYDELKGLDASMYKLYPEYHDLKYVGSYEIFSSNSEIKKINETVNLVGAEELDEKGEQILWVYDKDGKLITEEKIHGKKNFVDLEKILNITDVDIWDEGGGHREEEEKRILG